MIPDPQTLEESRGANIILYPAPGVITQPSALMTDCVVRGSAVPHNEPYVVPK